MLCGTFHRPVVTVSAAWPLVTCADPICVAPSMKATVPPDGVLMLGETPLTLAVNVTGWPKMEGFSDGFSVVLVCAIFTVCAMDATLAAFDASPL